MKQQKEDRRSRRTRHLVSDAFIELLLEKSYDAIMVQDILDQAGIGRTIFYAHYFDKKDALESTVEGMMETFSQLIAHREAGQEILLGADMFGHVHQHWQVFQALVLHGGVALWETGQAMLSTTIEETLASRLPTKHSSSVPLAVVSHYLAGAFLNLLKWWLEAEIPCPPEQIDQIFQQLVMPGVWATVGGKRA
ncbi:MAG: TetR/AcrR family transcriptional regulator [Ktedonobacteraceae bacterium]|nr:TetR/AcrR family transcriptional regulator [Ktedonobacteraceae bacterium]